jgi:hypothetical protein
MMTAEISDTIVEYLRAEIKKDREALRNTESEIVAESIRQSIEYWQAQIEALGY